jgi:predicted dehydrogenase
MLPRRLRSSVSGSGRMNDMVNSPDAPGDDPGTVTEIRVIDEPREGLVEVEITVSCSRASLRKDSPSEHPWFGQFHHRLRLRWGRGQMGWGPEGWIRIEVPRGELEDFIRAFRQAVRDADAYYHEMLPQRREWAQRDAQARGERLADPARRTRMAEDQARIDAALVGTGQ